LKEKSLIKPQFYAKLTRDNDYFRPAQGPVLFWPIAVKQERISAIIGCGCDRGYSTPCDSYPQMQKDETMESKQAIISFSQSEKVKSGLIWCSQCVQMTRNLPGKERTGAVKLVQSLVAMISNEAVLARKAAGEEAWFEVEKALNTARVMVDSGVSQEATYHLTQALSQVNRVGQKAMTFLVDQGLFTPSLPRENGE
jgi:hypothetical protein